MTRTPTLSKPVSLEPALAHFAHGLHDDLLTLGDLSPAAFASLLTSAKTIKSSPTEWQHALAGKQVILLFEKPSLRTRVSLEVGLAKLGSHAIYFDHSSNRIGQRESIKDYAKNLAQWVDCIVARTHEHTVLEQLAAHADIPIINALSDQYHPCQALADCMTLKEHFGSLDTLKIAYVGDGNNVCHSLMLAAALAGSSIVIITPEGFEPNPTVVTKAKHIAHQTGSTITLTNTLESMTGADAVYTDSWVSMGQEHENALRQSKFAAYQVNAQVMAKASPHAVFMHCLPAHRGVEVTDEVIDSPNSLVYKQAENRMHTQNAVFVALLGNKTTTIV